MFDDLNIVKKINEDNSKKIDELIDCIISSETKEKQRLKSHDRDKIKEKNQIDVKSKTMIEASYENRMQIKKDENKNLEEVRLIASLKEPYWEYIVFCKVMDYEYHTKLLPERKKAIFKLWDSADIIYDEFEAKEFMLAKMQLLIKIVELYSKVTDGTLKKGIGDPGEEGDFNFIIEAANEYSKIYIELNLWKMEFKNIWVKNSQQGFFDFILNEYVEYILYKIDEWYWKIGNAIEQFDKLRSGEINSKEGHIDLYLKLKSLHSDKLSNEIRKFVFLNEKGSVLVDATIERNEEQEAAKKICDMSTQITELSAVVIGGKKHLNIKTLISKINAICNQSAVWLKLDKVKKDELAMLMDELQDKQIVLVTGISKASNENVDLFFFKINTCRVYIDYENDQMRGIWPIYCILSDFYGRGSIKIYDIKKDNLKQWYECLEKKK